MPAKRLTALPRPVPVLDVLTPSDIQAAVEATLLPSRHSDVGAGAACQAINVALHGLMRAKAADPITIDATAAALFNMAAGCRAALQPLAFRLGQIPDDVDRICDLGTDLANSLDPVVLALLDASRAAHNDGRASERLILALAMVRRLEEWSSLAGRQFKQGAQAAEAARLAGLRQQAFNFATTIFAAYQQLTGQRLAISRTKEGGPDSGVPSGPLMRFTTVMYERLRVRCASHPNLAAIASTKELNPTLETIAAWLRDLRRPERGSAPRGTSRRT